MLPNHTQFLVQREKAESVKVHGPEKDGKRKSGTLSQMITERTGAKEENKN